jgi:hypothetical protein
VNDSNPWWLWPNLLSLDAPAVAVTWQVFLASVAGVAVPLAASAVLALVVWAAYLIDRALDARRGANASERHRVAGRNPRLWGVGAGGALVAAAVLAVVALPVASLYAGAAVAAATAGYFAAVHLFRASNLLDRGVKELSVGVVFAAGVAIPLLADAEPVPEWLPGAVAFAALCWLNCTLISVWEADAEHGPPQWLALAAGLAAFVAALDSPAPVLVAVLVSLAALTLLHAIHSRISVRAARVLADVVLLSPILVAVWS